MSGFKKRKQDAENRFKHDQELEFKAGARRNKLLGHWAADLMGISGSAADDYAKEVVVSDFDRPGDEDVLEKVLKDFSDKGVEMTASKLRKEMDRLMSEARDQIKSE